MTSFSTMSLYALTVKPPSATQDAVPGDFVGNGKQQILTANGSRLTLLEAERRQNGFQEIHSHDVFGIIRRIAKFRITGGTKGMSSLYTQFDTGLVILKASQTWSLRLPGLATLCSIHPTNTR
jgi:splicing factor 3B subunit 3